MAETSSDPTEHLRGIKGIRKRPAMYIGGTDSWAMTHAVGEAISNCVDQFLMGHATTIRVDIADDGRSVSVFDDGAGMPFDVVSEESAIPLATRYLTYIHASPTADNHVPHVHFLQTKGLRGVGIVSLNAVCEKFVCCSWRNGRQWTQSFTRGIADGPAKVTDEGDGRGTELRFTLDAGIFGKNQIDQVALRKTLVDRVHLFDGLCIELNGEPLFAERGLATMAESMSKDLQVDTAAWGNRPAFHMNETYDDMIIHAAAFGDAPETKWRAWANCLLMPQGGTHQTAFSKAMSEFAWTPAVALVHVMMKDPEFTGGCIEKLNVPKFQKSIETRIKEQLVPFCAEFKIMKVRREQSEATKILSPGDTATSC